jgi:signal peptidase I
MIEPDRVLRISRRVLLAATAAALLALFFRYRFVSVTPGCDSLAPRYLSPGRVLADRLPLLDLPLFDDRIEQGDVVVYQAMVGDRRVTRLAVVGAIPGDRVEVRGDRLWIRGEETEYPVVPPEATGTMPESRYLLFNTNPGSSIADSRIFGRVDERALVGRLAAVLPF